MRAILLSLLSLAIASAATAQDKYRLVPCDPREAALSEAPGNGCLALTVHRALRENLPVPPAFADVWKALAPDAKGRDLQDGIDYLRAHLRPAHKRVVLVFAASPGLATANGEAVPDEDAVRWVSRDKPYAYIWSGIYEDGEHIAFVYVTVASAGGDQVTLHFTISHSGRTEDNQRVEESPGLPEFFHRTLMLYEVQDDRPAAG